MAERRRDDLGAEGPTSDAIIEKSLDIEVGYDPDTAVYYVVSSGIPGLHVEAPTFEGFVGIVQDVAPDLIETPSRTMQLTFRRTVELAPFDGR